MGRRLRIAEQEAIASPEDVRQYDGLARKLIYLQGFVVDWAVEVGLTQGLILDVGIGPGYISRELAKRAEEVKIIGVELSSLMLNVAKKNIDEAGLSERVRFQIGNAEQMPFRSKSFDGVISNSSFHHWRNPVAVFNEIRRVLKDEGKFLICDLRRDAPGIPIALLYLLLSDWNREGFLNSVKAAYTLEECEQLLGKSELKNFQVLNLFMNLIIIPRDF